MTVLNSCFLFEQVDLLREVDITVIKAMFEATPC